MIDTVKKKFRCTSMFPWLFLSFCMIFLAADTSEFLGKFVAVDTAVARLRIVSGNDALLQ